MAKTANLMSYIYLSYIYIHNKNVSPDTSSFMDKFIKQIICVCVYDKERDRQKQRDRERERERERKHICLPFKY